MISRLLSGCLAHCGLHENPTGVLALLAGFVAWVCGLRVVAGLLGAFRGRLRASDDGKGVSDADK